MINNPDIIIYHDHHTVNGIYRVNNDGRCAQCALKKCRHCNKLIEPWKYGPGMTNRRLPDQGWRHVDTGIRDCQTVAEP